MKLKNEIHFYRLIKILCIYFIISGCTFHAPSSFIEKPLISLDKVNLKAIIEEQEGLEITWEDAKDVRDFYRGAVQHKMKAEKKLRAAKYHEALTLYEYSNDFLSVVLNYLDQDSAAYQLFEGHQILFFPNLLVADNNLKIGQILKVMKKDWSARRKWKQALSYVKKSLQSEKTQWGLSIQNQLITLIHQGNNN